MRIMIAVLAFLVLAGCGDKKAEEKTAAPTEHTLETVPEDLGDSTAPVQVRALQEAKEVKKQMDEQRETERELLKERD